MSPEPGPFHGHAELRQDAGESVVAMVHLVGRGIGSGVEMDETDAHVLTIRAGRIVRWQNFNERADALAAVGIAPPFLPPVTEDVPMELVETRTFSSRVIYERYRARRKSGEEAP